MQLRSEKDADLIEVPAHYMDIRSRAYAHEVPCGSCGRTYFADDEAYEQRMNAMEIDPDNLFVCDMCQMEIEDFSHSN